MSKFLFYCPKIERHHFRFMYAGNGFVEITVESPRTLKRYRLVTTITPLTDAIQFHEDPKRKDMQQLFSYVRRNGTLVQDDF